MLRQLQEGHRRNWSFLDLKTATLVIGSWRMIQGIYIILSGMTLLHMNDVRLPPMLAGINKEAPAGTELYPSMDSVGAGYVVAGFLEAVINMGLLINTEACKSMPSWPTLSIVFTAFYTYLIVYQVIAYEINKSFVSPFAEFVLFAMPLLGEVFHWVGIYLIRCFYKDMKYNINKYHEIPIRPFCGIVFEKRPE